MEKTGATTQVWSQIGQHKFKQSGQIKA